MNWMIKAILVYILMMIAFSIAVIVIAAIKDFRFQRMIRSTMEKQKND